jgi:hypothetical protein
MLKDKFGLIEPRERICSVELADRLIDKNE